MQSRCSAVARNPARARLLLLCPRSGGRGHKHHHERTGRHPQEIARPSSPADGNGMPRRRGMPNTHIRGYTARDAAVSAAPRVGASLGVRPTCGLSVRHRPHGRVSQRMYKCGSVCECTSEDLPVRPAGTATRRVPSNFLAALVRRTGAHPRPRADGSGRPGTGIHLGRGVLNPC